MNGRHACAAALAVFLCSAMAQPAAAQEPGDKGLTIAAPSSIGLIWHLSPALAIRPDLSFGFSGSDDEGSGIEISSHSFTLAGSVLFYTGRWEKLQTYVSPRLSYSWAGSSIEGGVASSQDGWGVAGSFGAQYGLGDRFAVFAEAGIGYSATSSETSLTNIDRTSWNFGTRTQIGATLYF
jgi:hypothetical protein